MKRNYALWLIILSFVPFIYALVDTVRIALANPVMMDGRYNASYQSVDKAYNDIAEAQIRFKQRYTAQLDRNGTSFSLRLMHKEGNMTVTDLNASFYLTRPDSDRFDQNLTMVKIEEGYLVSAPVTLPKQGRWILRADIHAGGERGFVEREFFIH